MSYIQAAFEALVKDFNKSKPVYLCLIENVRAYGGPEEGGWYYDINELIEYKEFPSRELAEQVKEKVEELAKELQHASHMQYGEYCLNQMEWLEARGLDSDYFPENDGPANYYVYIYDEIPTFDNVKPQWC